MTRHGVELMQSLGFEQFSILAHDRVIGELRNIYFHIAFRDLPCSSVI